MGTQAGHTHKKNLRVLQFLWRMQLQIHYRPVKLGPHVCVSEEPGEFHAQEAAG